MAKYVTGLSYETPLAVTQLVDTENRPRVDTVTEYVIAHLYGKTQRERAMILRLRSNPALQRQG